MTRRSLDWKFLLITAMIGGASALALYMLHGWQIGRTAQQLLVFAQQHEREQEWLKAADYLDRYLRVKPSDTQAKIRLAQTYGKGAEYDPQRERAIDLHYRALATGEKASQVDLRCELAELLLALDSTNAPDRSLEAERQARLVLKDNGEHPRAMRALALALNRQLTRGAFAGQPLADLKVLGTMEEARRLNPDELELAIAQAALLRESPEVVQAERPEWTAAKREQEADMCLDQFIASHGQSAKARLARFRYRTKYKLAESASDLEAAMTLPKDDAETEREILFTAAVNALEQARRKVQAAADAAVVQSLFEESERHFERLIGLVDGPQFSLAHLGLGDARLGKGEVDGAIAAWREGIERAKGLYSNSLTVQADFYGRIADTCLGQGRQADAAAALEQTDLILGKLGSSVPQSYYAAVVGSHELRRARWHIERRAYSAALPLLRSVLANQGAGEGGLQARFQASYLLGAVYGELGQWVEAATAYEQAANIQPSVVEAQLAAANAWLRAGRADLAQERADKAKAVTPSRDAWFTVAVAELQAQRARAPENRSWTRLDEALSELADRAPSQSSRAAALPGWRIAFLQADCAMVKAQPDLAAGTKQARRLLQDAEQKYGADREFLRQLCLVYQGLNLTDEADRVLTMFKAAEPQSVETSLAHARLLSMRGDDAAAAEILQQALPSASSAARERVRSELLRAWLSAKNWKEARGLLIEALERDPRSLAVLRRLTELDLERNDLPAAESWEQRLTEQGPVGESLARYFRAWRLFRTATAPDSPELRTALGELERVTLAQPQWAEASALKGMTLQRLGRLEEAVVDYERAVNNGDRRVVVLEQLVALLDRLERPADVEKYLARLESQAPLTQWATEFASAHEMRHERAGRGLELARKRAEQHPDDAAAQLWLGRLLMMANNPAEAESALERAATLAPANVQVWETLVTLFGRSKNQERLLATLERLESNSNLAAGRKSLLMGRTHQALGDMSAAERSFIQAAAIDENSLATRMQVAQFFLRFDPGRAKPHLEAALRIEPKSAPARQLLAIAQAAMGEMAAAESLLSALGDGQSASAENVRLHALLLVQQGGVANHKRATALLEDLVERKEGSQPVDRLLLARLYENLVATALEDSVEEQYLVKAETQLLELARVSDAQPAHLAAAAQFFMRQGRTDEASMWLKKLESRVDTIGSTDPGTIALVIETQLQLRDPDRAAAWLDRLQNVERGSLRVLTLQCRVACSRDGNADVEADLEPQAKQLVADATTAEQRHQLRTSIGALYRELNRLDLAERWYREAVSESPQQYANLVSVLAAQGKMDEAISLCEAAAKTDDSAQPALALAVALVESSGSNADFQRADKLLQNAVKRFGTHQNLLYTVALVAILRNANEEAVALLRQVVALNARHVPALNNLALLLADAREHREEAVRLIDEAIRIAGPAAGLLDTKGSILVYCGRSAEAIESLQAATRDPKADPRHHFHLAIAYCDTGRIADAKRHLRIALDRQLQSQVLTSTDRELLTKLLASLNMEKPVSTTAVVR